MLEPARGAAFSKPSTDRKSVVYIRLSPYNHAARVLQITHPPEDKNKTKQNKICTGRSAYTSNRSPTVRTAY